MNPAVIYGAGKIGALLYSTLSATRRYEIQGVWDRNPENCLRFPEKGLLRKVDLASEETIPSDIPRDVCVFVAIYSPAIAKEAETKLRSLGFTNVISDRSQISQILSASCQHLIDKNDFKPSVSQCFQCPARRDEAFPCPVFDKLYGGSLETELSKSGDRVVLNTLGLLLTTKCNLTCVGCNHLRDHFEKSHNVDFDREELISDLARVVEAADFIKSVVIVGGEPLIHPDFAWVVQRALEMPKIGFVQIISNGSYLPKGEASFEVLRSNRVVIEVSGYGTAVGSLNIKKRTKFLEALETYGINHRYDETFSWTDFGGFHHRGYQGRQLKEVYDTCCFVSNDLLDGKLHKCSRSAYGQFIGKTPTYQRDYVDVRAASSTEDLRNQLKRFLSIIPSACQHCDGTSTKSIPAGVQVKRPTRKALADAAV